MAADPLKEVLLKVIQERHEQIEKLSLQFQAAIDPVVRADLEAQIAQLRRESFAAEQALGQAPLPPASAAQAPHPQIDPSGHQELPRSDYSQLLSGEPDSVAPAPKGPSKAALEAQIRELQVQLLDVARAVERAGPTPDSKDVAELKKIREALQTAMRQIGETELQIDIGELPPTPSPSQLAEADNLVRRSALEQRRGNTQASTDMLRKAAEIAPGAISVQEALGDDLLARGQAKPAAEVFARALAMSPRNPSIERKYALAISRIQAPISFEQAMQMGDAPLTTADAATAKAAAFFSLLLPGAGQIILGDYVKGALYMGFWIAMIIWLALAPGQWRELLSAVAGKSSNFHPLILVPLLGSLGIAIAAAVTCKGPGQTTATQRKQKGNHPIPPVDLPF